MFLVLLCGFLPLTDLARAQDSDLGARLQQSQNEERFRLLESKVNQLIEDQRVLFERFARIDRSLENAASAIRELKLKLDTQPANVVTRDQLEKVVAQVSEVEKNRVRDRQIMQDTLAEIKKLVLAPEPVRERPTPASAAPAAAREFDELVEYTVEPNQTISAIIAAYNDEFRKNGWATITPQDIRDANPGIDINRVRAKQKIRIPIIKKKP